jgi:hypothetical protein
VRDAAIAYGGLQVPVAVECGRVRSPKDGGAPMASRRKEAGRTMRGAVLEATIFTR